MLKCITLLQKATVKSPKVIKARIPLFPHLLSASSPSATSKCCLTFPLNSIFSPGSLFVGCFFLSHCPPSLFPNRVPPLERGRKGSLLWQCVPLIHCLAETCDTLAPAIGGEGVPRLSLLIVLHDLHILFEPLGRGNKNIISPWDDCLGFGGLFPTKVVGTREINIKMAASSQSAIKLPALGMQWTI